jgi:pimeloyl-ACP methyl ester carboxylesterase
MQIKNHFSLPSPLSFRAEGHGSQTVVLIHGFCEDHRVWDGFVPALAARHQVVAVDLPGFGQSELLPADQPPSIERMADALHQTLAGLGVERPILVGHSLGGYVALAYAQQYPEALAGLGLFHSSALPDLPERKQARDRVMAQVRANGVADYVQNLVPGLFASDHRAAHQPVIYELVDRASRLAPEAVAQAAAAMRDRSDRRDILAALAVPVLWVVGGADPVIPLEMSLRQVGLARDSTVHVLAGVGHMGMFEAPSRTLRAVSDFCQGI